MKFATVFLFACFLAWNARTAEDISEWRNVSGAYEYKSEFFSCKVNKSGVLSSLVMEDKKLVDMAQIFGRLRTKNAKNDTRIFQNSKAADRIKVKEKKDKTMLLASGVLQGEGIGEVADFKEKISFSPNRILFEYEVKTSIETEMKRWVPFCSLLSAKIDNFTGWALEARNNDEEIGIYGIPDEYSKEKESWDRKLKGAKFILDFKTFELKLGTEDGLLLDVSDGRSWKGNNIEIVIKPELKGRSSVLVCPVGSVFKWSFELLAY
jgi:hypothetical protein